MNKAILIGRLTRDPELRYTSSNRAVCQFTVAIDRPFTNQSTGQREADFINVVAWDKTGENIGKYMTKGRLIAVEGRIQTRNYENNEGRKVYVTEEKTPYDFADNSETNSSNEETMSTEKDPFESFGEQIEISDNDLPF